MSFRISELLAAALLTAAALHIPPVLAADIWAGKYSGHQASYTWKATIASKGPGVYVLHETVGSRMPECTGELDTSARLVDGKLIVSDSECSMTILKHGLSIRIDEKQCNTWHGAACEFSADLARR